MEFSTIKTNLVNGKRDPNIAAQFYLREGKSWGERLADSRDEFLLDLMMQAQPLQPHYE